MAIVKGIRTSLARKKSKFGNSRITVNGEKYRSKKEYNYHQLLLSRLKNGEISDLRREVPFILAPPVKIAGRTKPALRYFADFVWAEKGETIVCDCKGWRTDIYRIKRHLMATVHGITILET
jgi:hypothetical protein